MQRGYVDLDQGQLHYRCSDNRDLPALLLLHQSPSDSAMYESLAQELRNEYWLIAPDHPGFGNSDALPNGFSLEGSAAAVIGLLDQLNISRCLLFGHHSGASIAVEMAATYAARFDSVALCGPTLLSPELQAALPGLAAPFPLAADGSHLQSMWQRLSAKEGDSPPELLLREALSAFAAGDSYPQAYTAVAQQDFASRLRSLEMPVLVFAGSEDILFGQLGASYACLKHGTRRVIQGAGSYVCDRHPAQVATLLREFFRENRHGSATQ
jgi:haloalkane dehalogenase